MNFETGQKPPHTDMGEQVSEDAEGVLITGQNGLVSGTRVAAGSGWQSAEKLNVGDRVLTFDHGMQPVMDIQRETLVMPELALPGAQHPVLVPKNTINNLQDIWLMPQQGLLVESDTAFDPLGDPFAVVPARALLGFRGVRTAVPEETLEVTTLAFANDEVIYAESGLLMFCPRPRQILSDGKNADAPLYNVLDLHDGRYLVRCLDEENGFTGFVHSSGDVDQVTQERVPEGHPLHV